MPDPSNPFFGMQILALGFIVILVIAVVIAIASSEGPR